MGFTGYSVTIETLVGTPLAGALESVRSWLSLTWPIRALYRPPRTEKLLKHSRFAPRKLKFAADSSLEEAVTSELVSEFPASREFTGNFIDSGLRPRGDRRKNRRRTSTLRVNSLRARTGNFLTPNREFRRAIREASDHIRENALRRAFALLSDCLRARSPLP
jgi:hypothetical protein